MGYAVEWMQTAAALGLVAILCAYRFGAIILRPQASHVSASQLATMKLDGPLGAIVDERGRGHPAIGDR